MKRLVLVLFVVGCGSAPPRAGESCGANLNDDKGPVCVSDQELRCCRIADPSLSDGGTGPCTGVWFVLKNCARGCGTEFSCNP